MAISSTSEEHDSQGFKPRSNAGGRSSQERRGYNKDNRDKAYTSKYKNGDAKRNTRSKNNDRRNSQSGGNNTGNDHGKDYKKSYSSNGRNNAKGFNRQSDRDRNSSVKKENKVKEQQPDKMDTIRRLEKEKKAMQKKNDSKNHKSKTQKSRPQMKMKRTNNIDWTKEYENDSFDDDGFY